MENDVIKEIEHDDNCFWSYVGSLLGGLVGTIPWIMLYYFFSFNLSSLPVLIPIMAVGGYKFFKGVVNAKTFRTISILSVVVYIFTLVVSFPYFLAIKENMEYSQFINDTSAYQKYFEDVIQNAGTVQIVFLIIGIGIAYGEINHLLRRYRSTNNMIKDMNTFIRKDNDPIDSDDYNGIQFMNQEESPVKMVQKNKP